MTSLPVPDSPVSSTVVSVDATCVAASAPRPDVGVADHATVAGARVQFRGQRADARFELLGARVGFGCAAHRLGELLMRDRQRDVLRDAPRDGTCSQRNAFSCFDQNCRPNC